MMDESDIDNFFDAVAGKPAGTQPSRNSHRLGAAVRAAVLRRRTSAEDALSTEEALRRDALLDSLEQRGLFGDPRSGSVVPFKRHPHTRPVWARLGGPMALAAALALCAVSVRQLLPVLRGTPEIVERGSEDLVLRSADPAHTERELARELTAAGVQVQAVQINDLTWSLSIDFPRTDSGGIAAEVRDRARGVLAGHGMKAPDVDSFTILVESAAH